MAHRAAKGLGRVAVIAAATLLIGWAGFSLLRPARAVLLGDDAHEVEVLQLSADGRTVVGMAYDIGKAPHDYMHAYVWTRGRPRQVIRTREGGDTYVESVSADGTTVVGRFYDRTGTARLFRWTRAGGLEDLGAPPGLDPAINSECGDRGAIVSADGAVIVGSLKEDAGNFRWTRRSGFQPLDIPGRITAATPDDAIVVGLRYAAGDQPHVFRWSAAKGFEDLGAPAGAAEFGYLTVEAVSADGGTIVGIYMAPTGDPAKFHGYRWTRAGGFQDLPGEDASVCAISADGSQVVGRVAGLGAVRWIGAGPPQAISPPGPKLIDAIALSADGRTVAGRAMLGEGWFQGFVYRQRR